MVANINSEMNASDMLCRPAIRGIKILLPLPLLLLCAIAVTIAIPTYGLAVTTEANSEKSSAKDNKNTGDNTSSLPSSGETTNNDEENEIDYSKKLSYGDWQFSIFFNKEDLRRFRKALYQFEAYGYDGYLDEEDSTAPAEEMVLNRFAAFHLRSIMVRGKNNWTVWINDLKLNNKNNWTGEYEIKAVFVSKERADFIWKPKDKNFARLYSSMIPAIIATSNDTDAQFVNRLGRIVKKPMWNEEEKSIYFSLRPNQTFSTETFNVYEGKIPDMNFIKLTVPYDIVATGDASLKKTEEAGGEQQQTVAGDGNIAEENGSNNNATAGEQHKHKRIEPDQFIREKRNPKALILKSLGIE